jgi:nitroreductase
MEFGETVRKRRMVRNYDPSRTVSRDTLNELLEYAIRAPSAGFSQGWRFLVLDDEDSRERFWAASAERAEPRPGGEAADAEPDSWLTGLKTAPALIIALSDKDVYLDRYAAPDKGWTDRDEARWPVPYWDVDTGMASMIILLAAVDAGLASCFFGVPPEAHDRVRAEFDIAPRLRFVGVMSIGHPAPDRKSPSLKRGRRQLADVVSYGRMDRD